MKYCRCQSVWSLALYSSLSGSRCTDVEVSKPKVSSSTQEPAVSVSRPNVFARSGWMLEILSRLGFDLEPRIPLSLSLQAKIFVSVSVLRLSKVSSC